MNKAGVEEAGASMASFSALSNEVSVVEPLKAAKRDGSTTKKRFEQWVRDSDDPKLGAKGDLPDGLSFGKGGSTTATYQRLNKQYRRSLVREREKDVTAKELEERHIAEQLKYAEQELECETQVARAISELTDSDLRRELNARGLDSGLEVGHAQLEEAVSAAAAAAAAAEEGGDVFTYRAFYAGYVDPHRV